MTLTKATSNLFSVEPSAFFNGPSKWSGFRAWVQQRGEVTRLDAVSGFSDILIDQKGRRNTGDRYTWSTFNSVLSLACPGLTTAMRQLFSGIEPWGAVSQQCGLTIFERSVRAAFAEDRFPGCTLLVDEDLHTVDGYAGVAYSMVSNSETLRLFEEAIEPFEIIYGSNVGRDLTVQAMDSSVSVPICSDIWHPLISVHCSESSGKSASARCGWIAPKTQLAFLYSTRSRVLHRARPQERFSISLQDCFDRCVAADYRRYAAADFAKVVGYTYPIFHYRAQLRPEKVRLSYSLCQSLPERASAVLSVSTADQSQRTAYDILRIAASDFYNNPLYTSSIGTAVGSLLKNPKGCISHVSIKDSES